MITPRSFKPYQYREPAVSALDLAKGYSHCENLCMMALVPGVGKGLLVNTFSSWHNCTSQTVATLGLA
jgi:hypothetical protein